MGTAERRGAPEGGAARTTARPDTGARGSGTAAVEGGTAAGRGRAAPGHDTSRGARAVGAERAAADDAGASGMAGRRAGHRPLWVEEPARRRRLPDPVRTAAVRAVLVISVTLIQAMVAVLCTLAESWLAFPMVISSVVSTVLATWAVLDVWVTRQVWNQRNGVVSAPSSTARALRRERRRARRQQRAAARAEGRIRRRGAARRLSHS